MITFDELQSDLTVDNIYVRWIGDRVLLEHNGKILTTLSASGVVAKIKRWCEKNTYRCEQIIGDRILL